MISKINKGKVILSAFVKSFQGIDGHEDIPEKELEKRREACRNCPYNIKNTPEEKRTLLEKVRDGVKLGDFCTICGCQIKEKTMSPTEGCALEERGRKPLWNRIKVETSGKTENLINLDPDKINIDANQTEYVIYADMVSSDMHFNFGVESKKLIDRIDYVRTTCTCFDIVSYELSESLKVIKILIKIKYGHLPSGIFDKWVYVGYKDEGGNSRKMSIKIKGKRI